MSDYPPTPTVDQPGSLFQTIGFGSVVDGTLARKKRCLDIAKENVEQAQSIVTNGPHPTTAVLQLELAIMHVGNAVALIYDRDIEGKIDEFGLHNAAARAIVAYADAERPELSDIARFAAKFVRARNDYAYRHQSLAVADVQNLYKAAAVLLRELRKDVQSKSHESLQ